MSLSRPASSSSSIRSRHSRKGSAIASLVRATSRQDLFSTVAEGLRQHYVRTLKPFEDIHQFHSVSSSPPLEDADFTSRPSVLLVGQYSTGKTSLIRYLLGEEFPGCRIGPEPTTDKFHVILGRTGDQLEPACLPGNALATKQQNPLLNQITLIDTPGILSGEKQTQDRGYDYVAVLEWFAARSDLILLLFDAHKLDISDELRRAVESLARWDDKIRILLNKADGVESQQLMRVFGALLWSLGKAQWANKRWKTSDHQILIQMCPLCFTHAFTPLWVLTCPEVPRVYCGSWWDRPLRHSTFRILFEQEEQALFRDFRAMPQSAALRKLNDLIKRARLARVLALIQAELHSSLPLIGKEGRKQKLLAGLEDTVAAVEAKHGTCSGDLPPLDKLRESLRRADWTKFRSVDKELTPQERE